MLLLQTTDFTLYMNTNNDSEYSTLSKIYESSHNTDFVYELTRKFYGAVPKTYKGTLDSS
jgi:hypothetical protein